MTLLATRDLPDTLVRQTGSLSDSARARASGARFEDRLPKRLPSVRHLPRCSGDWDEVDSHLLSVLEDSHLVGVRQFLDARSEHPQGVRSMLTGSHERSVEGLLLIARLADYEREGLRGADMPEGDPEVVCVEFGGLHV